MAAYDDDSGSDSLPDYQSVGAEILVMKRRQRTEVGS